MSANLEAKKQVVEEIKEKIQKSKSVIFVDYKGLTVAESFCAAQQVPRGRRRV